VMHAELNFTALKDIHLSKLQLGNDAFRLFSISSMYSNSHCYDANAIRYEGLQGSRIIQLATVKERGNYLLDSNQVTSDFQIIKGAGSAGLRKSPGSPDSPSIRARILKSSLAVEELVIQAYLHGSPNKNDDSLSVWLEWRACPEVIQKGQIISATIEFSATPPEVII